MFSKTEVQTVKGKQNFIEQHLFEIYTSFDLGKMF